MDVHSKPCVCVLLFLRLQIVLLHGQAFTSKTWEELGTLSLLATNGYQALALDLPGTNSLQLLGNTKETFSVFY